MKTFYTVLAALGAVAFLVWLVRVQLAARRGAKGKVRRRQFQEREKERDRVACQQAEKHLDSGTAPRESSSIPGAAAPAGTSDERLRAASEARRRASYSTPFDPDLPAR